MLPDSLYFNYMVISPTSIITLHQIRYAISGAWLHAGTYLAEMVNWIAFLYVLVIMAFYYPDQACWSGCSPGPNGEAPWTRKGATCCPDPIFPFWFWASIVPAALWIVLATILWLWILVPGTRLRTRLYEDLYAKLEHRLIALNSKPGHDWHASVLAESMTRPLAEGEIGYRQSRLQRALEFKLCGGCIKSLSRGCGRCFRCVEECLGKCCRGSKEDSDSDSEHDSDNTGEEDARRNRSEAALDRAVDHETNKYDASIRSKLREIMDKERAEGAGLLEVYRHNAEYHQWRFLDEDLMIHLMHSFLTGFLLNLHIGYVFGGTVQFVVWLFTASIWALLWFFPVGSTVWLYCFLTEWFLFVLFVTERHTGSYVGLAKILREKILSVNRRILGEAAFWKTQDEKQVPRPEEEWRRIVDWFDERQATLESNSLEKLFKKHHHNRSS